MQEDVKQAINNLTSRRTAGPSNITNEILKYGDPLIVREITTLLKKILYIGVRLQK